MAEAASNPTSGIEAPLSSPHNISQPGRPDTALARILVSDDSPDIQQIYMLLLPQHGFEVIPTPGGRGYTTVELCRQHLPDLVITDINKPDLNGYEVCRAIRRDAQTAHIPLLFVTAMNELLDRKRGRAVGADDYIIKPFLFEGLLYRLMTLLTLARDAKARLVTLTLGRPDFEHVHPITGIPGPQALAHALPRLTSGKSWAALTFNLGGFDLLLRTYDRATADDLLLRLTILLRMVLSRRAGDTIFMAHPCYSWHITLVGPEWNLHGIHQEVQALFVTEVQRRLRAADIARGYMVYTDSHGAEQSAPLPTLTVQRIDWRRGPLRTLKALWDRLDSTPPLE